MYGDYLVVDDVLEVADRKILSHLTSSPAFPYRFHASYKTHDALGEGEAFHKMENGGLHYVNPPQLTHHIYMEEEEKTSPQFEHFIPLILSLKKYFGNYSLLRMKVNCSFILTEKELNPHNLMTTPNLYPPQIPHIDLQYDNGTIPDHWVCVYYINDSLAPTYLFDQQMRIVKTVTPRTGRALLFDGQTYHAASNPHFSDDNALRYVVNIALKPEHVPHGYSNALSPNF